MISLDPQIIFCLDLIVEIIYICVCVHVWSCYSTEKKFPKCSKIFIFWKNHNAVSVTFVFFTLFITGVKNDLDIYNFLTYSKRFCSLHML